MTEREQDWNDPRRGITLDIYCDHPRHRRRWEIATFQWMGVAWDWELEHRRPGDMLFLDGETHDAEACGGHPPSGCVRQWTWEQVDRPSAALRAAARRRAKGRTCPSDGASRAADDFLDRADPLDERADIPPIRGWEGYEWRHMRASDRQPYRRRPSKGASRDYAGITTISYPTPRTTVEELSCERCDHITEAGASGRSVILRVTAWRLFELLDGAARSGAREVPLRALIRLNSTH